METLNYQRGDIIWVYKKALAWVTHVKLNGYIVIVLCHKTDPEVVGTSATIILDSMKQSPEQGIEKVGRCPMEEFYGKV